MAETLIHLAKFDADDRPNGVLETGHFYVPVALGLVSSPAVLQRHTKQKNAGEHHTLQLYRDQCFPRPKTSNTTSVSRQEPLKNQAVVSSACEPLLISGPEKRTALRPGTHEAGSIQLGK